MWNTKKDYSMIYYQDGVSHLKSAILMDNTGNIDFAKKGYKQAILKFTLSSQQEDINPNLKPQVLQHIESCQRRLQELNSMVPSNAPIQSSNQNHNKNPSIPQNTKNAQNFNQNSHQNANQNSDQCGGAESEFRDKMSAAIMIEKPDIKFDDVAGLAEAKIALNDAVVMPQRYPHFFESELRKPWNGILLYGPPGTGKSYLAKATANEAGNSTFLTVSTADLVSKWLGESEKLIKALFQTARENKPAIIFIDEIDSLLSARSEKESEAARRIKTEFLIQMDGVGNSMDGILLLAATNLPWGLDTAFRRRFEKKIYIPLPNQQARKALLKLKLRKTPNTLTESDIEQIAALIEGYSGSDIKTLAREAAMVSIHKIQQAEYFCEYQGMMYPCNAEQPGAVKMTMREIEPKRLAVPPITGQDFLESIQKSRPSVAPSDLIHFEQWTAEFGQEGN